MKKKMFSKDKCIIGQGANTDVCPIVDWRLTRKTQMSSMALSSRSAPGYICDETSPPLPLTCTILLPNDHCCIANSTDVRKYNYKYRHKYKIHLCCAPFPCQMTIVKATLGTTILLAIRSDGAITEIQNTRHKWNCQDLRNLRPLVQLLLRISCFNKRQLF